MKDYSFKLWHRDEQGFSILTFYKFKDSFAWGRRRSLFALRCVAGRAESAYGYVDIFWLSFQFAEDY